jgi:hypothetical protein
MKEVVVRAKLVTAIAVITCATASSVGRAAASPAQNLSHIVNP